MTSAVRHLCLLATLLAPTAKATDEVLFNRDVRPILSQNCFACHGPDPKTREGDLRLDLPENAVQGGESGDPALVPGNPEESSVWLRITSTDPDDQMPPPEFHKELSDSQKKIIRNWIKQGAKYESHWAFLTPKKPSVPKIPGLENPIDQFVVARLREEQLELSPHADHNTLIRRLCLDLTGLPPAAFDESAFASPQTAIAHLLASPHFGERMALPWMDAARYADTNGYSIDGGRHAWLWRDWVIHAFNTNKPYDEFLVEQLAGDLLPDPSESQLIATAFNRHHTNTHEGGTIPEENLNNYVADRVKTFGESVLGLTTACAQCHDHKYDPFTQQDYYQLYAFFNTLSDRGLDGNSGNNSRPAINASSPLSTPGEVARIQTSLTLAESALREPAPDAQLKWETDLRVAESLRGKDFKTIPLKHLTATAPNGNPDSIRIDQAGRFVSISGGAFSAYNICCEIPADSPPIHGVRAVFEPDNKGLIGYGKDGTLVLNTLSPCFSPYPAGNIDHNSIIPAARLSASSHRPGFEASLIPDTSPHNGWSPSENGTTQHLTYTFPQPIDPSTNRYLTTELVFNYPGRTSPSKFRLELFTGNDPDSPHPADILAFLETPPANRPPEQAARVKDYFESISPAKAPARYRIANLRQRLDVLTKKHSVMIMDTAEKPRPTHFLERGVYSDPKHRVHPGTPSFLPPIVPGQSEPSEHLTRLELANWLTRPDHPLTARVAVNNIWATFFGRGLVHTRADFGSQGSWPSHPALLDWLAIHFQESGWDVKALVTLIVNSRTYQQSSVASSVLIDRDPDNELLARGPRFRLSAEHIRDQALALSGILVPRIGGPSVKPYQPGDLWRQVSHYGSSPATAQTFVQDHGEDLHRRSLYTYWKRTLPPPDMAAFDAPNREICTSDRGTTNTPLQAFVLLNNPQYIEAARFFAAQALQTPYDSDRDRLAAIFKHTTARRPNQQELDVLENALSREVEKYENHPTDAHALLAIGEARTEELPESRHAAWTNICQLLLNLSETITRH